MKRVVASAGVVAGLLSANVGWGQSRVQGVVRRPMDSVNVPVSGVRVVLHRVGRATQGPIDSLTTDPSGRFAFRFATDTTASFLLSARFAGIEYFSQPLATNPARPDTALELVVFDTSSAAPVRARTRTMVVSAPDAIGARTVIDWFVLQNPGRVTRVGADSLTPTWSSALALGAEDPQVGDPRLSQISSDAVEFGADSVMVLAPIAPGEKELFLQYQIPAGHGRLEVALGGVDSVDVFLEETEINPPASGWVIVDSQAFEGRRFRRLTRTSPAVTDLDLRFPGLGFPVERLLPWIVVGFGVLLAGVTWTLVAKRRPGPATVVDLNQMADEISALDQQLTGLTGSEARVALERRAALAERLRGALAGRRPGS